VNQTKQPRIILASTSPYRVDLLSRLNIQFDQIDPNYEELQQPGESPEERSIRLARGKAMSVISYLDAGTSFITIGSDQVAHLGSQTFSKPQSLDVAAEQLATCSGRWVSFTTAICLIDETNQVFEAAECFKIKYRELTTADIHTYLKIDEPFDCAGSIKVEASGITLLEDTNGRDINTLYGLPLMLLRESLTSRFHYSL
jgi:septum formation protein